MDKEPKLDPPERSIRCFFCNGEGNFKRCDGETLDCDPCDGTGSLPWGEAEADAEDRRVEEKIDKRRGK